ncbi:MAG: hypothetical protein IKZ22_06760, partial [Kiritimatiellae bacterium]|nr:hypothetical protein [Kiritimatiellia bacterium]
TAPAVTFMQRSRLDPSVIYEDMIRRGDLKDVKLLYAPQCRFLPKSVITEIRKFQARGGLLIADERLTSALKADIAVPLVSFAPPPASDLVAGMEEYERSNKDDNRQRATRRAKARMVTQAEDLRKALASRYRGISDSSSPDIVVFNRKDRSADYVFAINDRRTFGDYVGMWGRQMEKGLPCSGWVSLNGAAGRVGAVYELSRGVSVPFERDGGDVRVKVDFETTDGRMLMFLPRPIAAVKAAASAEVERGGRIEASFRCWIRPERRWMRFCRWKSACMTRRDGNLTAPDMLVPSAERRRFRCLPILTTHRVITVSCAAIGRPG